MPRRITSRQSIVRILHRNPWPYPPPPFPLFTVPYGFRHAAVRYRTSVQHRITTAIARPATNVAVDVHLHKVNTSPPWSDPTVSRLY
eukprot:301115-Hanusia_phi.AAC.1